MVPSLLLSGISLCLGLEYMTTPPLGASSSEYRVGLSPHLSLTLCRALAVVLVSVSMKILLYKLSPISLCSKLQRSERRGVEGITR